MSRRSSGGRRARLLLAAVAVLWLAAGLAAPSAEALCGDLTGDGQVRATDALRALQAAVTGVYNPRADISMAGVASGTLTATDALAILKAAVASTIPDCAAAVSTRVIAVTASCDFATGGLAEIDRQSFQVRRQKIGAVSADAVVRVQDSRLFVVNRFGADSVQELDPNDLTTLWQCSVGNGSNPHDLVLVSAGKGYVTRYDSASLAIIDPSVGPGCKGFLQGTIDLSAFADEDGFPEMDQMVIVGKRLFVALQRLDRNSFFTPTGMSLLAVIDTETDTVMGSVELALSNPFAQTKGLTYDPASKRIYLGGPGLLFSDLSDGGIEAVDPDSLRSLGLILTGAELGGDLTDFVLAGRERGYAVVAAEGFVASLIEFDAAQRRVSAVLARSEFLFSDIELTEDGQLWLSDRNCFDPGLRVFSIAERRELTERPIYPGLTPFSFLLLP